MLVLAIFLFGCEKNKTFTVKTETLQLNSLAQVVLIEDSLVKPILYTNVSGFEILPSPEAKVKFISAILPAILVAKHHEETTRIKINKLREKKLWELNDTLYYREAKEKYKASNLEDLYLRIGTLPNSIIIAQAAIETGWGESRFFLQARNLFGIWSFNANESRIAAGKTRQQKIIYIRSYQDIFGSIIDYFEILSRSRAYKSLRKVRLQTSNPFKLLPHLKNYSETKTLYIRQLKKVIEQNNLTQYDNYQIDPDYLVKE